MNESTLRALLESVQSGRTDVNEAVEQLRRLPFEDIGFASVDHHRSLRCGFPEVIFCPGKTAEQVVEIFARLAAGGGSVLATRAEPQVFAAVAERFPAAEYHEPARAITLRQGDQVEPAGHVAVVSAGTSDLPVAEEARYSLLGPSEAPLGKLKGRRRQHLIIKAANSDVLEELLWGAERALRSSGQTRLIVDVDPVNMR